MKNLICWIRKHKFESIKIYIQGNVEKVRCTRCKKYFFINHSVGLVIPWSANFEQYIDEIENMTSTVLSTIKEVIDSGEYEEGKSMIIHIPKKLNHSDFGQEFKYKGSDQPNTKRYSN